MNKPDQKEFDIYLEGNSDLSRAYAKLDKEEPSPDLNKVVLEHAKSDITNNKKTSRFSFRLDSPLAMAAVIILCVSLVLLVPQDEILLEPADEIIPESLPVITGQDDQFIHQRTEQKTINKINSATAVETPKPDLIVRDREASFAGKKELQTEITNEAAKINEAQISETRTKGTIMSAPATDPEFQSEVKRQARRDSREEEADISSGVAPLEMVEKEAGVAERQSANDSITTEQVSPEALSNQIKLLIQQDKIEKARSLYQRFIKLYPDQPQSEWFSDQEITLLLNR